MRIIKILVLFFVLFAGVSKSGNAGIFNENSGGRSAALGLTSITMYDFWSAINNQAGLASLNKISAGVFVENKFLLKSLESKYFALALPFKQGTLALSINRFGETAYNETMIGISYGMKLSANFKAGIELFHFAINQNNYYGNSGKFSFRGGFIYEHEKKIRIAFHISNPSFTEKSKNKIELAEIVKLGLSYPLSETLTTFIEFQSHSTFGKGINSGIEFQSSNKLAFRIGYSSVNEKLTFGIGVKLKNLIIDLASSMHSSLGYSPQLSLTYQF